MKYVSTSAMVKLIGTQDFTVPDPIPPKAPGNWILVSPPSIAITPGVSLYLVWTWMHLDQAIQQGIDLGKSLADGA
jgi:hypothetical protein